MRSLLQSMVRAMANDQQHQAKTICCLVASTLRYNMDERMTTATIACRWRYQDAATPPVSSVPPTSTATMAGRKPLAMVGRRRKLDRRSARRSASARDGGGIAEAGHVDPQAAAASSPAPP